MHRLTDAVAGGNLPDECVTLLSEMLARLAVDVFRALGQLLKPNKSSASSASV